MKKLILNSSVYHEGDVLSRTQLKKVLGGGYDPDSGPCDPVTAETCYNCCMSGRSGTEEEMAAYAKMCDDQCG